MEEVQGRGRGKKQGRGVVIAVDGPSGVGKSTVSRMLAHRLGCRYIDTGAMYRAVALLARKRGVPLEDPAELARLGREMEIDFEETPEGLRVRLHGEDVTRELRLPGVGDEASRLSRFPEVRKVLVDKQRELARSGGVVMEGRDIGTVVLPHADLKVFLDADIEERARRRSLQWKGSGIAASPEQIREEIAARDRRDRSRKVAPLSASEDAVWIDNTRLRPGDVLERILDLLAERGWTLDGREGTGGSKGGVPRRRQG